MKKIIDIWVPGRPRTKGSLGYVQSPDGRGVLADSPQSKDWRRAIANAAILQISDPVMVRGRERRMLHGGWPKVNVPLTVSAQFYYARNGATMDMPIGRQFGDLDKLMRNVLDALQDAKVYKDDAQVVSFPGCGKWYVNKWYPEEGARIMVFDRTGEWAGDEGA